MYLQKGEPFVAHSEAPSTVVGIPRASLIALRSCEPRLPRCLP